jgi:hypothetical protein
MENIEYINVEENEVKYRKKNYRKRKRRKEKYQREKNNGSPEVTEVALSFISYSNFLLNTCCNICSFAHSIFLMNL